VDGTTLFVPSGWWHQVENIGATISINHNWCNACNLITMNRSLKTDLDEVRHTISDVKEMMDALEFEQTCQRILLINSGWNWETLWGMLSCIMERLLRQLEDSSPFNTEPPIPFSVSAIEHVVNYWTAYPEVAAVFEAAQNQYVDKMVRLLEMAKKRLL